MSQVTTNREIDLSVLGFPARQRWDGTVAVIDADDMAEADLQAAIDAAPSTTDTATQRAADEQAWRDAVTAATSMADIKALLLGTNTPVSPVVDRKP